MQLAMRPPAKIEMLLEPPLLPTPLQNDDIAHELKDSMKYNMFKDQYTYIIEFNRSFDDNRIAIRHHNVM